MRQVTDELNELEQKGLRRFLRSLPASGGRIQAPTGIILNFSSNDYLNLASHDKLKQASVEAVQHLGCGATASRLMSGHLHLHDQLETDLAAMLEGEAALVFGSGFLANLGVITALAGRGDEIFSDRLNHASLIDGIRLSGANWQRYRHNDLDDLARRLQNSSPSGRRLIVSDSIFSMDGDLAPLAGLADLAERYKAILVIDEAHAIGVMGPRGGGVCQALGIDRADIRLGTMSKALGSYGGFAVCSTELRDLLINRARSFIYSTALPPACLASAQAAMTIIQSNQGALGQDLLKKAEHFRNLLRASGLPVPQPQSQILQIPVGDNNQALTLARETFHHGILTTAIRPPTVPAGTARLRLSVTLAHSHADLELAADVIATAARKIGLL